MSEIEDRLYTLDATSKKVDKFRVTFLKLPENITNVLGRQVKSIGRPAVVFNTSETRHRGHKFRNQMNLDFDPVQLVFFDDDESVVSMFLYAQVFRQVKKYSDVFGNNISSTTGERDDRFDIRVEVFNHFNESVEEYELLGCFIQNLDHSTPIVGDGSDNEINVTISYDDINIKVFDKFISTMEKYDENRNQ